MVFISSTVMHTQNLLQVCSRKTLSTMTPWARLAAQMSCLGGDYQNDRQHKDRGQGNRDTSTDDTMHLGGNRCDPEAIHRFDRLDFNVTKRAHGDHAGLKYLDLKFLAGGQADTTAEPTGCLPSRKPNLN
jgi:hypothetical protein